MHPGDLSAGARLDRVKYAGKAGVAARVEYDVGEGSLHAGLVGVLFRAMITRAVERGMVLGIEIADLPALFVSAKRTTLWGPVNCEQLRLSAQGSDSRHSQLPAGAGREDFKFASCCQHFNLCRYGVDH